MQATQKQSVNRRTFLFYTMIFLVLAIIIFTPFVFAGQSLIHQGDGFHQHYPFFREYLQMLRQFLTTGQWKSWDWSINLGADTLLTYGYYVVGDPFVYLGLLFPRGAEELAFHLVMLVRIWAVGASFLLYARYRKFSHWTSLAAAIMYGFSHYVMYNAGRHPFFIHPLMWFPLLALGVEKIFHKKSGAFFALMIGLSAISNFYFFYMLTLMIFMYAVIRYFTGTFEKSWRTFGMWLARFTVFYIIGLLISAVVFLPQVYGFLTASRSPGTPPISMALYPTNYYYLLLVNAITPGTIFWSVGGFSVFTILALPWLIRKRKDHQGLFLTLGLLMIMILIPIFGSIMNGLSSPYNRFSFVFPFYLALLFIAFFEHLDEMTKKDLVGIKRLLIGLTVLYSLFSVLMGDYLLHLAPIVIGWLGYYSMTYYRKGLVKPRTFAYLTVGLVALNMATNTLNFYTPLGKNAMSETIPYGEIDAAYTDVFAGLEKKLPTDEWYRIGASSKDNQVRNQYTYLDVMGLNSYASITNGSISDFAMAIENSQYQIIQPLRNGIDDRRIANQALGVRYIITDAANEAYLPADYVVNEGLSERDADMLVAETTNATPFAYVEDQHVLASKLKTIHPVQIESMLEEAVIVEQEHAALAPLPITPSYVTHNGIGTSISGMEAKERVQLNQPLTVEVTEKDSVLEFELEEPERFLNQEVFLYLEGISYEPPQQTFRFQENTSFRVHATFNNQEKSVLQSNKYSFSSYFKRENMLIHLNEVTQIPASLIISLSATGNYHFDNVSVVSRPYDPAVNAAIAQEKQARALVLETFEDEYVKGTITTEGGMLVTSIPYSDGWTVTVNGEKVATEKVNIGFIGLPLPAGEHTVEMTYTTPFLKIGAIFTIIGLFSVFVIPRKMT